MTPRCIIVTGAASGFGREIATRLARAGEAVVLADLNARDGAAVTEALRAEGGEVKFIEGDVSREAQAKRIVAAAVEWKGGLDVLVNNAGISHAPIGFLELSEDDFDRMHNVNFKSVFHNTRAAIPELRKTRGCIVNVASVTVDHPRYGQSAYVASKGAVVGLTRALAVELARDRVRCNAVMPVAARTGFFEPFVLGTADPKTRLREIEATIPLGRVAEPGDIAAAVVFLASRDAEFLTGVCLPVDGGRSI
jgi:3-oxoacyl-[acyl-carrier protein] reductase